MDKMVVVVGAQNNLYMLAPSDAHTYHRHADT